MKSTRIFKILSFSVLAAVVVLLGIEAYRFFYEPVATSVAYIGQVNDSIQATGWVIRREQMMPASSGTIMRQVNEGEKVRAGQTVAVSYASKSSLETVSRIEDAELKLQQLEFALNSFLDSDAALRVDSVVSDSIIRLHGAMAGGDYAVSADEMSEVKTSVLKRSYSYTSTEEIEAAITETKQTIQSLQDSLSGAASVRASVSGVYSASCDGYEDVLTPDILADLTPSSLNGLTPVSTSGFSGKMINENTWYYAVVLGEETAAQLEPGQEVTLRFSKGLSQDCPAFVQSISRSENGQVAVVFSCTRYISQVTLLRHQQGEIVLHGYEGLLVPANALRLNEDGDPGVFCRVGAYARFKKVELIYRGDGYYLVEAAAGTQGETVLRVGDQVISTSETLTDGMVIPNSLK